MDLDSKWTTMKAALLSTPTLLSLATVRAESTTIVTAAAALVQAFIDDAWEANKAVPGTKVSLANEQLARIQAMAKQAGLFSMTKQLKEEGMATVSIEEMTLAIEEFESTQMLLKCRRVISR